jgi:hypothetical protein
MVDSVKKHLKKLFGKVWTWSGSGYGHLSGSIRCGAWTCLNEELLASPQIVLHAASLWKTMIFGYGGASGAVRYFWNAAWMFHVSCNPWKTASSPCLIATQKHSLHMPNMAEVYFGKLVLLWRFLVFGRKACEECCYGPYIISWGKYIFQLLRFKVKSNIIMIIIRVKFARIRSGMGGCREV